jgi:hypothetical protein
MTTSRTAETTPRTPLKRGRLSSRYNETPAASKNWMAIGTGTLLVIVAITAYLLL